MDVLSSFLSIMTQPNLPHILTIPPFISPPKCNISSVFEDKLQATNMKSPSYSPTPLPSFTSAILNTLDDMVNKFIDPPTRPSIDPNLVLSDNFAPVAELPPTECKVVEGILPSCLDGAYIRNGPNPQFFPHGPYHLFDGDGMLHCIRISNGKVILCSRFVKTNKYMVEHIAKANVIPNMVAGFSSLAGCLARVALAATRVVIAKQFDTSHGIGVANTSLALFGNRLYALCEYDLPYEIKLTPNGDIQTLGRCDFDGGISLRMTAHPKVDHDTGEAFAFSYDLVSPFFTYFRFDSKGNKHEDVPIFSMLKPSYAHDFAITKKYAIFPDIQIIMDPMKMIMKGGSMLHFDPIKVSRVGVIPRYASEEKDMRWFEVPGFNIIHAINAWDEVDKDGNENIVIIAPNILSTQHTFDRLDLIHALVEKVKINLKTRTVSRKPLSTKNLDFAVINPSYVGKKNKYVYAAVGAPMPKITGVVKLDLSVAGGQRECIVASRMYGPGCYGGEPFFVANEPDNPDANEDDGYLVSYVHDENTGESRFIVMDAKSPVLDVLASVKLPQRVPYGFHGLFIRDKDLTTVQDTP